MDHARAKYRVGKRVGRGAFGDVLLARRNGEEFVIKSVHTAHMSKEEVSARACDRELGRKQLLRR